jgi:hypothetical protein
MRSASVSIWSFAFFFCTSKASKASTCGRDLKPAGFTADEFEQQIGR